MKKILFRRYSSEQKARLTNDTFIAEIPAGWSIVREQHATHTDFLMFEEGGAKWPDDQPRSALAVTVFHPDTRVELEARVDWPSTSDKRPVLARCLTVALRLAAEYADELNEAGEDWADLLAPEPDPRWTGNRLILLRSVIAYAEGDDRPMEDISLDELINDVVEEIPDSELPDELKRSLRSLGYHF